MDYIPHTPDETRELLNLLGLSTEDDLFSTVPSDLLKPDIPFPSPLTEMEVSRMMAQAADRNTGTSMDLFMGGGAYDHFIPSAVGSLISRSDFATAYTPYQAEVSQGTLQTIYEFQTLICRLTGMETANASMYDGASALAEAALMACRITRKNKVAIASTINPRYLRVVETYLKAPGIEWVVIPAENGKISLNVLRETLDDSFAGFFLQQPNYFGILESVDAISEVVHNTKALLGATVYPHSLGLLKLPGSWDADIVSGDLQSLGMPLQYGGPYAGFIAIKNRYVRQLPGRLVGRTKDADGKTGYVLTLQTREQHIRRAKAMSNICTNQALCALASTIYLSLIGPEGFHRASEISIHRAHELQEKLCALKGVSLLYDQQFFNEFLLSIPVSLPTAIQQLNKQSIQPGIAVSVDGQDALLVCATEKITSDAIDRYVFALTAIVSN